MAQGGHRGQRGLSHLLLKVSMAIEMAIERMLEMSRARPMARYGHRGQQGCVERFTSQGHARQQPLTSQLCQRASKAPARSLRFDGHGGVEGVEHGDGREQDQERIGSCVEHGGLDEHSA